MTESEIQTDSEALLEQLFKLTGREDRMDRKPILSSPQEMGYDALFPHLIEALQEGMDKKATCDLLNRILLVLGIKPFSCRFFEVVFNGVDFSKFNIVKDRVDKFRIICMLEYGSFRYGYKRLKSGVDKEKGVDIEKLWKKYFPSGESVNEQVKNFKSGLKPIGLEEIENKFLFTLGYLLSEKVTKINGYREKLRVLLDYASTTKDVIDYESLTKLAKERNINDLNNLVGESGLSNPERLLYPTFYAQNTPYRNVLSEAKEECTTVDTDKIHETQEKGKLNTTTYLGMHDINVYVATSMRDPLHFTTNHAFVTALFREGDLKDWNLRYFDPTQSYVGDRVKKGLIESLMIKRADVTIYNAQEADTFGKDSEAAVALAQGKEVIVYVARLFADKEEFKSLYEKIDSSPRSEPEQLILLFKENKLLTSEDVKSLNRPEATKMDYVAFVAESNAKRILSSLPQNEINAELMHHGYSVPKDQSTLIDYAAKHISLLEKRAITFKDVHPLSFQISSKDGVAHGVIVTRTVPDTSRILKGLMTGSIEYEIAETTDDTKLLEKTTHSPIRVVTKDPILTTAFWSEFSRERLTESSYE